jgi:enolase-phosphatase E1
MALRTVVLDIEGTTSSTWFVHRTLYPYSRERFRAWIAAHQDRPDVQRQIASVRELSGRADADVDGVVDALHGWLDRDEKVTPLKAFQGWIWDEGFAAGDLTSHFFDDAIPEMRAWHAAGKRLVIFSSGSLSAQHAWFGHTPEGSLLPLISEHFDTENGGPKREASSYRKIAAELGEEPSSLVFLSDLVAELDAARAAGWHTVGVRREGDQYFEQGVGDHLAVTSFAQLDLSGDAPSLRA